MYRHALKDRYQYHSAAEANDEDVCGDTDASEMDDGKNPVHEEDAAKTLLNNSSPVRSGDMAYMENLRVETARLYRNSKAYSCLNQSLKTSN